ncbi:unnamed protein product [Dicrocoelium dendriticum]|nr:unnamed protein product [Dicrocoelium dendriticum]
MEFLGILAIAREKQEKRDKEVKRMVLEERIKNIARLKEIEKARASSKPCSEIKGSAPSVTPASLPAQSSFQCSVGVKNHPSAPRRDIPPPATRVPPTTDTPPKDANSTNSPGDASLSSKSKGRCNLSFTALLELAKKNVPPDAGRRVPYEDLLPCPRASSYRSLDSAAPPKKKQVSASHQRTSDNSLNTGASAATMPINQVASLGSSQPPASASGQKLLKKESRSSVCSHPASPNSTNVIYPDTKKEKEKLPHHSRSAIAEQLCSRQVHVPSKSPRVRSIALSTASVNKEKIRDCCSDSLPKSDVRAQKHPMTQSQGTQECLATKKPFSLNSHGSKLGPGMQHRNNPKKTETNGYWQTKGSSMQAQPISARGIAAQLRVNFDIGKETEGVDFAAFDDYESDDSFIDDSEAMESRDYARVVRDVHKALRFDPRKYKDVNPWDDLRSMEANFRDIDREERRSARLGAQEDAAELERDMLRKKQKKLSSR